jgi:hypothetical protein
VAEALLDSKFGLVLCRSCLAETRLRRHDRKAVKKVQRVMIESYEAYRRQIISLSHSINLQYSCSDVKMAASQSVSLQDTCSAWTDPLTVGSLP